MAISTTRERVPIHTAESVNQAIRATADARVQELGGKPEAIAVRL